MNLDIVEELCHLGEQTEPCSYLKDRVSTLRFVNGFVAGGFYRGLLDRGYRRSGMHLYRPACSFCQECEVIRVPVPGFRRSKGQRQVWNRGQRFFETLLQPPECTEEKLEVYRRYLAYQHGHVEDAEAERYTAFLVESCLGAGTVELQLRVSGRLAGVGLLDRFEDALSTVYFYFDPDFARLSPGVYSALQEIELARQWGLAYYYLGYYIRECPQMNYKDRFQPCELKPPGGTAWRRVARG